MLARQGFASPRQRRARPCWLRAVPASNLCDGRLRREHFRIREVPRKEERPASLLAEESRPEIRSLTVSRIQGLTGRSISEVKPKRQLALTRSITERVTRPKLPADTLPTGVPNTVRLNALKNSARNVEVDVLDELRALDQTE